MTDDGARFENLVASHLLKWVQFQIDTKGREVDFVVLEKRKPLWLIEAKWSDGDIARGLKYLKERFPAAEAWQISATGTKDYVSREDIRVAPACEFLATLV